jgi:hypothetical protein
MRKRNRVLRMHSRGHCSRLCITSTHTPLTATFDSEHVDCCVLSLLNVNPFRVYAAALHAHASAAASQSYPCIDQYNHFVKYFSDSGSIYIVPWQIRWNACYLWTIRLIYEITRLLWHRSSGTYAVCSSGLSAYLLFCSICL